MIKVDLPNILTIGLAGGLGYLLVLGAKALVTAYSSKAAS